VQGLKVKFSVKAPALTAEAKQDLDKEEQKKQARLRKAQKSLGL
jgi:hypothetical protein